MPLCRLLDHAFNRVISCEVADKNKINNVFLKVPSRQAGCYIYNSSAPNHAKASAGNYMPYFSNRLPSSFSFESYKTTHKDYGLLDNYESGIKYAIEHKNKISNTFLRMIGDKRVLETDNKLKKFLDVVDDFRNDRRENTEQTSLPMH